MDKRHRRAGHASPPPVFSKLLQTFGVSTIVCTSPDNDKMYNDSILRLSLTQRNCVHVGKIPVKHLFIVMYRKSIKYGMQCIIIFRSCGALIWSFCIKVVSKWLVSCSFPISVLPSWLFVSLFIISLSSLFSFLFFITTWEIRRFHSLCLLSFPPPNKIVSFLIQTIGMEFIIYVFDFPECESLAVIVISTSRWSTSLTLNHDVAGRTGKVFLPVRTPYSTPCCSEIVAGSWCNTKPNISSRLQYSIYFSDSCQKCRSWEQVV